jgi:diguanylate cyclase (GGDEF)-like protein
MAYHDALTDLPNRILFFEHVAQGLALARRNKTRLALMFIDFDKFKPINDTYGHAVGDQVLQEAAKRMSGCLRNSDLVGRMSGDEFVGLLLDINNADVAASVANKIRQALEQPFIVDDKSHFISSSIGVAIYPEHGNDEIELARNADCAMYRAKKRGGNIVMIYS